jgi:hypothetical protein
MLDSTIIVVAVIIQRKKGQVQVLTWMLEVHMVLDTWALCLYGLIYEVAIIIIIIIISSTWAGILRGLELSIKDPSHGVEAWETSALFLHFHFLHATLIILTASSSGT